MSPIITVGQNIKIIHERNILLKIREDPQLNALLNEEPVRGLLSIPNLCHDEIRIPIDELVSQEATLTVPRFARGLLSSAKKMGAIPEFSDTFNVWFKNLRKTKYFQILESEFTDHLEKGFANRFDKMSSEEKESLRADLISSLGLGITEKQLLTEDRRLLEIEKRIKEKTGVGILVPFPVFVCPNCNSVLSTEEYKTSKKCVLCNKRIKREKAKAIYAHRIPQPIKDVWTKNLWFEAFLGKLLVKLKWKTYLHVLVMGSSGIFHEVDVLAIKKGTVLVSECKTGKVSRQDVFNFWAKVNDLKSHTGILALLRSLPESDTRGFIEKNPMMVLLEKAAELKEDQIISKLIGRLIF